MTWVTKVKKSPTPDEVAAVIVTKITDEINGMGDT